MRKCICYTIVEFWKTASLSFCLLLWHSIGTPNKVLASWETEMATAALEMLRGKRRDDSNCWCMRMWTWELRFTWLVCNLRVVKGSGILLKEGVAFILQVCGNSRHGCFALCRKIGTQWCRAVVSDCTSFFSHLFYTRPHETVIFQQCCSRLFAELLQNYNFCTFYFLTKSIHFQISVFAGSVLW